MSHATTDSLPAAEAADLKTFPKPGTALTQALATGVAAGQVAAAQVKDGLPASVRWVANLSVLSLFMLVYWTDRNTIRDEMKENRALFREEQRTQRERDDQSNRAFLMKMDALTTQIQSAVAEMRASRISVEQAKREIVGARPPQSQPEMGPMPRGKEDGGD